MTSAVAGATRSTRLLPIAAIVLLTGHGISCVLASASALRGQAASPALEVSQFLTFCTTGVAVMAWTYRTGARVHAVGARHLSASPAMAVASYFIPIVNLFVPYAALRDFWKASIDPIDWEAISSPLVMKLWWFTWVVGNCIGLVVLRLDHLGQPSSTLLPWSALSNGLGAVSAACVIYIIRTIERFAND